MLEDPLGNSKEMDLFESLISTNVGLDELTHLLEDKEDWKGSHFMVPFMFAVCAS
jgi:hypothetical protein